MPPRRLSVPFTEAEYEQLKDVKGDRTWQEAVLQQFGVED